MMPPNDSQAGRHTGGWIFLGAIFIVACLYFQLPYPSAPGLFPSTNIPLGIDINQASSAELACIPGVGDNLAQRIVHYRQAHGPIQSLSQLQQVPGIGPAKAQQLAQSLLDFDEQPTHVASKSAATLERDDR